MPIVMDDRIANASQTRKAQSVLMDFDSIAGLEILSA